MVKHIPASSNEYGLRNPSYFGNPRAEENPDCVDMFKVHRRAYSSLVDYEWNEEGIFCGERLNEHLQAVPIQVPKGCKFLELTAK